MFKFENIHDLYINYEVFVGGRQISDFIVRHDNVTGRLHPNKIDTVYINANAVMDLQNSSIRIPAEHYFIYKIDDMQHDIVQTTINGNVFHLLRDILAIPYFINLYRFHSDKLDILIPWVIFIDLTTIPNGINLFRI